MSNKYNEAREAVVRLYNEGKRSKEHMEMVIETINKEEAKENEMSNNNNNNSYTIMSKNDSEDIMEAIHACEKGIATRGYVSDVLRWILGTYHLTLTDIVNGEYYSNTIETYNRDVKLYKLPDYVCNEMIEQMIVDAYLSNLFHTQQESKINRSAIDYLLNEYNIYRYKSTHKCGVDTVIRMVLNHQYKCIDIVCTHNVEVMMGECDGCVNLPF